MGWDSAAANGQLLPYKQFLSGLSEVSRSMATLMVVSDQHHAQTSHFDNGLEPLWTPGQPMVSDLDTQDQGLTSSTPMEVEVHGSRLWKRHKPRV